jgi:hypothetical protein
MSPSEFRIRRGVTAAVLALSVCATAAACGSGGGADDDAPADPPGVVSGAAAEAAGAAIDACALVSADQITSLMGTPTVGEAVGEPETPSCIWENADTLEVVSVDIGKPGTAPNGTLPPGPPGSLDPATPGPDGMRFLGSGVVEFPAAKRANTVQVAVNTLRGDDADNAALDLARQIGSQLNG